MSRERLIFTRFQGGATRYYGNFRRYANVGGGREALIPRGETRATEYHRVAEDVYDARLVQLREMQRALQLGGVDGLRQYVVLNAPLTLGDYVERHLVAKARDDEFRPLWQSQVRTYLREAVEFLGASTCITTITTEDCVRWADHLRSVDNGRGANLSPETVRKRLNCLRDLFGRAVAESLVLQNPVLAWTDYWRARDATRFGRMLAHVDDQLRLVGYRVENLDPVLSRAGPCRS